MGLIRRSDCGDMGNHLLNIYGYRSAAVDVLWKLRNSYNDCLLIMEVNNGLK